MAGTETDTTPASTASPAGTSGPAVNGALLRNGEDRLREPITLADSLITEAGWSAANFETTGPNPPYLHIGRKLWVTLTECEPCFSSARRDRGLFRSKIAIAAHLEAYDALMVDPIAFEECFGPGEGTEATFPFGTWLTIRGVDFGGISLWGRRCGDVTLPLEPLAVASAIWLRRTAAI
ncbi:hypothetical protein [Methylobacterium haplocladii]|uniref:Uncharacterized protein n=1 Tax=Methylobacterium haplocladii TaxID=1176176 RepID=A0A512IKC4_9HYPH|nr:hypothetical protein [Methylobacterium haplocladii]GEO98088.1 hypothetical protein MHA02_04760 [Methylobacterium haplocladii]GJD85707.1 hypothetical protein HPGCJGGD_3598 [Methylobacterium haplocladii]GLS59061.1 hypothetical protein GCM10007887_17270 [Methylobacterium haplocladii]